MDDEPHASSETPGSKPTSTPRIKPRQKLWRRFIRYEMRKAHQRRAEHQKKKVEEKPEERAARKTADATVWIAVFTVILALVGIFTLVEVIVGGSDTHELAAQAKRQADKMNDVSDAADKIRQAADNMVIQDQRIADNAKDSFDASNRQSKLALDASIEASRLDQRAWIGIVSSTFEPGPEVKPDTEVSFRVGIINTGKTPALKTQNLTHWQIMLPNAPLIPSNASTPPSESIIFPSGGTPSFWGVTEPVKFTQAQVDALKTTVVLFRVWGEITYTDIFHRPHWTHYCVFLAPNLKDLRGCDQHNETDDEGEKPREKRN